MKKIVFLVIVALFAFSCSSDDSIDTPAPLITVPSKVTVLEGSSSYVYQFSYDAKRRVSKIVKDNGSGSLTMEFSYNTADQVTKATITSSTPTTVNFDYEFGRMSHISSTTGFDESVTYNPSDELYYIFSPNLVFGLEDNGDISQTDSYFTYDLTKKGAFANVNANLQFYGIFLDDYIMYFGSKLPLVYIGAADDPQHSGFTNTFNTAGYITKSTGSGREITFEYILTY
jgi:hypothetical protein